MLEFFRNIFVTSRNNREISRPELLQIGSEGSHYMGHKSTKVFAFGLAAALAFGAGGLRTEASSGSNLPRAGIAAVFDFSGSSFTNTSTSVTSTGAKTIADRMKATAKISGGSLYRTISKSAAGSSASSSSSLSSAALSSVSSFVSSTSASVSGAASGASVSAKTVTEKSDTGLSLIEQVPEEPIPETASLSEGGGTGEGSASGETASSGNAADNSAGEAGTADTGSGSDGSALVSSEMSAAETSSSASASGASKSSTLSAGAGSLFSAEGLSGGNTAGENTSNTSSADNSNGSAEDGNASTGSSSSGNASGLSISKTLTKIESSARSSAQGTNGEIASVSSGSGDQNQAQDSGDSSQSGASTSDLAVATVSDYVNVRAEASTDSEIVGKLHKDGVATILEDNGDGWVKIQSGSVTGYISKDFLATGDEAEKLADENKSQIAEVTTETLRVRAAADINSDVITLVPQGEKLDVIEETDGWLKVNTDEGEGYISADYADVEVVYQVAESIEEEQQRLAKEAAEAEAKAEADTYNRRVAVVNYAMQYLGNPYVWGGTSLTNGIDCSGFTMQVYAHFGYSLPHYDVSQRGCGTAVSSLADALPGDLVFYSGHVAIYCGGGQVVHASNPRDGIKVSNANYRSIVCIRRIIQD